MGETLNTGRRETDASPPTSSWVIQSLRSKEPRYWAGYFFEYDSTLAIRFCRQEDAERVIEEQFSRGKQEVYVAVQQFLE